MKIAEDKSFPVWVAGRNQNEELATRQAFKFWEAPYLRCRDGSYINW